jgi:hypothetical protein
MQKSRRYLFRAKLALHVQQAEVVEWVLEMTPDFLCVFFSHILRPPHINRMFAVAFYQTRKKSVLVSINVLLTNDELSSKTANYIDYMNILT